MNDQQTLSAERGEDSVQRPCSALRFADLRDANAKRQREWCPDATPDLSFRGNELAGETGEACNVIKKLERERQGWRGSRATREQLAEELADVIIVADLIALDLGIDLGEAVRAKFDATSAKYGLSVKIAPNNRICDSAGTKHKS